VIREVYCDWAARRGLSIRELQPPAAAPPTLPRRPRKAFMRPGTQLVNRSKTWLQFPQCFLSGHSGQPRGRTRLTPVCCGDRSYSSSTFDLRPDSCAEHHAAGPMRRTSGSSWQAGVHLAGLHHHQTSRHTLRRKRIRTFRSASGSPIRIPASPTGSNRWHHRGCLRPAGTGVAPTHLADGPSVECGWTADAYRLPSGNLDHNKSLTTTGVHNRVAPPQLQPAVG